MSASVRVAAAAGPFYPADLSELRDTVDRLLDGSSAEVARRPWGIIVPHAGYAYSGPIAATAYGALRPWAAGLRRVVLLGPAHFVPLDGCAVPSVRSWSTPLGDVAIDGEMRDAAIRAGGANDDGPHLPEHALEVQLPFLQRLSRHEIDVLPVAVGRAAEVDVGAVLDAVEADLVVVSTDLSHYLDIAAARVADRRTANAIVAGEPAAIGPEDACGVHALRGAIAHASVNGRAIRLLDLRTSGDTAGDPDRVVGYGAFSIG